MAVKKLSAIASGTAPATTDQVVGVQGGTTDVLFTFAQLATEILGGTAFAGFAYTDPGQLSLALGTITTNLKALNITATWNAVGTTFDAPIFLNVINTASAAGSLLADFQVGGTSQFSVSKVGQVIVPGGVAANFVSIGSGSTLGLSFRTNVVDIISTGSGQATFSNGNPVQFQFGIAISSGSTTTVGPDTFFVRDAAGIVGLSNGATDTGTVTLPAAQRTYNNASSALANFERMEVGFAAHSNVAAIDVAAGGTGTVRNFGVYIGGAIKGDYGSTTAGGWTFQGTSGGVTLLGGLRISSGFGATDVGISWAGTGIIGATSGGQFGFTSSSTAGTGALDTILTRAAAANFAFGAADAASPVAQTLSVQNVVGGTAATNGVNWTLIGSRSTGTGTSGDLIFQTGLNPGSGTTQAAATTAFTIKGETQAVWLSSTLVDVGYTYSQPTTGQTVTLGNKDWHTIIDPAGALLALTVKMPASPVDGQLVDFKVSQAIMTLTVSPNSGQSVVGGPAAGASAAGITYNAIYRAANTTWYF